MSRIRVEGQGAFERDARPIGEVQRVGPGDLFPCSPRFHFLQVDHLVGIERTAGGGQNQTEAKRDGEAAKAILFVMRLCYFLKIVWAIAAAVVVPMSSLQTGIL